MDFEREKHCSLLFYKHIGKPIMDGTFTRFKARNAVYKYLLALCVSNVLLRLSSNNKEDQDTLEIVVDKFLDKVGVYSKIDRILFPINLTEYIYGHKSAKTDYDEPVNLEGSTYETV